jgi:hypothetical protein
MTCSLLNFRKSKDQEAQDSKSTDKDSEPLNSLEREFGDDEQTLFREALTAVEGLHELEASAISITKIYESPNHRDGRRLCVVFEISNVDLGGEGSTNGKVALTVEDVVSKLNDKDQVISKLAEKNFPSVEVVHPAEVIGDGRAAKKARKSMMAEMYGDSTTDSKAATCVNEKAKEND